MKHDDLTPFGREVMKEEVSEFESVNLTEEEENNWTREKTEKAMIVKARTKKLAKTQKISQQLFD